MVFVPATVGAIAPLALGIELAAATHRLAHGKVRLSPACPSVKCIKVISNDMRRAPLVILSLLLPCAILILFVLTPVGGAVV